MTEVASSPSQAPSRPSRLWAVLRLLGGWAAVGLLAYRMWTPGEWPALLFAWVLLTILADEFGGWFGYIALLLGGLAFFAPVAAPEQWTVIVPLVGGALLALLLVKHSGGAFVLPFAAGMFALPLLALGRFGTALDPGLTLPAGATFQRTALTAMLLGVALSFVRQLATAAWRYGARRRSAQLAGTAQPTSAPAPETPSQQKPGRSK